MFLTSPLLNGVTHGFFTRKGGVSEGIFASLNCGPGSGDNSAHVRENRVRVARSLAGKDIPLLSVHQVHGNKVITVTEPWEERPQADAMVTRTPGIAIGVLAADCAPVLFADRKNRVVAASHAGWRGAFAGIVAATVDAMCAIGAEAGEIRAAIGPCIAQASYEVDAGFHARFHAQDVSFTRFFAEAPKPDHFLFDLKGFVRHRLKEAGISYVNTLENDTYIEEDAFFSYRRATHRFEPDYGRQVSVILLTPE